MSKKYKHKKKFKDWTRDCNPQRSWKYKVVVSRLARQAISVEKFESIMNESIDLFKDEDFALYENGTYTHPDKQVKVIMAEVSKDVMLMMMPFIVDGIKAIYCQLTTESKHKIVLDIKYPMVMGKQRLERKEE